MKTWWQNVKIAGLWKQRWSGFVLATLKEGECIPRGYGIAYWEYDRNVAIAYPVPFNKIAGVLIQFWVWLRKPHYIKCPDCGRKTWIGVKG